MKLAAVVILYNPTNFVVNNIKTYADFVEKLYVFDNTEKEHANRELFASFEKVDFIQDFRNEGIAKRLNDGCKKALEDGFEWVLTMDQDTSFTSETITVYFNCFQQFQSRDNVIMFSPQYRHNADIGKMECTAEEVDEVITSATLLQLSLFKKVGDFDEALFIDSVDHEYCLRAKLAGCSIIRFNNVFVSHQIGTTVVRASIKSLFTIKKAKEIHVPLRLYYMYRNMLYLEDKYRSNKIFCKQIRGFVITHIKVCLLYGRNSWKIIRYLRAAKKDFKNNKMGRIEKQIT